MPKKTFKIRRVSILSNYFLTSNILWVFLFYFVSFKYISNKSVTMDGINSPPHKKPRKQI
jgi:hypothetical protein